MAEGTSSRFLFVPALHEASKRCKETSVRELNIQFDLSLKKVSDRLPAGFR